jgi:hypothetical protein
MSTSNIPRVDLPPDPLANSLKTGTEDDCPRVPEDAAAINLRTLQWYDSLHPQNLFHCFWVGQVVVTSLRIEHVARVDRRARDRGVLQARLFWDDNRRLEAEVLGAGLAKAPAAGVNQLRRTPQGCDWMIGRWAALARAADRDSVWNEGMKQLAFDLLGAHPEARQGEPGDGVDLATFARLEVAALRDRKAEVAGLDALDRSLAQADYQDETTPANRQLRRHDAELHRRLKWFLAQLNLKPLHIHTSPRVFAYINAIPSPVLEPEPPTEEAASPSAIVTEPEAPAHEADPESDLILELNPSPETLPNRREAGVRKSEARRDGRRRKLERLRA